MPICLNLILVSVFQSNDLEEVVDSLAEFSVLHHFMYKECFLICAFFSFFFCTCAIIAQCICFSSQFSFITLEPLLHFSSVVCLFIFKILCLFILVRYPIYIYIHFQYSDSYFSFDKHQVMEFLFLADIFWTTSSI